MAGGAEEDDEYSDDGDDDVGIPDHYQGYNVTAWINSSSTMMLNKNP